MKVQLWQERAYHRDQCESVGDHPLINSVVLSRRGTGRGIRLIPLSALLRFLHDRMSLRMSGISCNGEGPPKYHE